ncbi:hypothetical protein ABPG77_007310 [Micractinium sp. CCAP 211/92]
MTISMRLSAALAVLALLAGSARAGDLKAACTDSSNWSERNDATTPGTYSPISQCVATTLKIDNNQETLSNILLGGKGSGSIIGIPAASGSGGCTDPGRQCMSWCQALCCLAPGCKYAEIYAKSKSSNYGVYSEYKYLYYCRLFSAANYEGSHNQATCYMNSNANCQSVVTSTFGIDNNAYYYLMYNSRNSTCGTPSSGTRRLQGASGITKPVGRVGPFVGGIEAKLRSLKIDPERLRAAFMSQAGKRSKLCKSLAMLFNERKCYA